MPDNNNREIEQCSTVVESQLSFEIWWIKKALQKLKKELRKTTELLTLLHDFMHENHIIMIRPALKEI